MGAERSFGDCARHRMAVDAGSGLEYALPLVNGISCGCRLPLLLDPAIKLIARLNINTQKHFGVLCPAILRPLAQIKTRLVWIDPHILFGWLGIRSVLPASRGTQKLWSVSADSNLMKVGVGCCGSLTGTCSSFAVTI